MAVRAADFAARKTLRLTTRGRKSGQPRTVVLWFVASGERGIWVQHTARRPADWYRNLAADGAVSVDFGTGQIAARGVPITDPERVRDVLAQIRRKYWSAWLIRLLARGAIPVAAEITW